MSLVVLLDIYEMISAVSMSFKPNSWLAARARGPTRPYYTLIYYAMLCYTMLCYATLYYAMLCYTIPYYTILYYTTLYYTIYYILYTVYYILYTIYYTTLYYTILHYIISPGMRCSTASCSRPRSRAARGRWRPGILLLTHY